MYRQTDGKRYSIVRWLIWCFTFFLPKKQYPEVCAQISDTLCIGAATVVCNGLSWGSRSVKSISYSCVRIWNIGYLIPITCFMLGTFPIVISLACWRICLELPRVAKLRLNVFAFLLLAVTNGHCVVSLHHI